MIITREQIMVVKHESISEPVQNNTTPEVEKKMRKRETEIRYVLRKETPSILRRWGGDNHQFNFRIVFLLFLLD